MMAACPKKTGRPLGPGGRHTKLVAGTQCFNAAQHLPTAATGRKRKPGRRTRTSNRGHGVLCCNLLAACNEAALAFGNDFASSRVAAPDQQVLRATACARRQK